MKLSIITINYNNKVGLQKTIDSVVSQTFKDYEWIIIDGGSTDGSKELIEEYSQYITYWVSEPDKGIYNAMNKGILKAQGEYLYFLNSGDALYSKSILDEFLSENIYGDIIYGNLILENLDKSTKEIIYKNDISLSYFLEFKTICHQATIINKELFKNNLYNESLKLVSDWEFEMKQVLKGKVFQYINKFLVIYDNTGLTSKISETQINEYKQVLGTIPQPIRNDIDELLTLRRKMQDGYIKTIYYYSQKGKLQQKILNIAIHILNFIDRFYK